MCLFLMLFYVFKCFLMCYGLLDFCDLEGFESFENFKILKGSICSGVMLLDSSAYQARKIFGGVPRW